MPVACDFYGCRAGDGHAHLVFVTVHTMAEGVSKQVKIKAASEALVSQFVDLIRAINDPLIMAASLVSKKIIDRSILERMMLTSSTPSEKACKIINAVSDAVMINPDYFVTFCDILDNEFVAQDIAKILKGKRKSSVEATKATTRGSSVSGPSVAQYFTGLFFQQHT